MQKSAYSKEGGFRNWGLGTGVWGSGVGDQDKTIFLCYFFFFIYYFALAAFLRFMVTYSL